MISTKKVACSGMPGTGTMRPEENTNTFNALSVFPGAGPPISGLRRGIFVVSNWYRGIQVVL
jgi:hypothetical protein